MLTAVLAVFNKIFEDHRLPGTVSRQHCAATQCVLGDSFLLPVQEHQCVGPIHSDPNEVGPDRKEVRGGSGELDAEIGFLQRHPEVSGSHRLISVISIFCGDHLVDGILRLPSFDIVRRLGHRDAPARRIGVKEESVALQRRKAAPNRSLGEIDDPLGIGFGALVAPR